MTFLGVHSHTINVPIACLRKPIDSNNFSCKINQTVNLQPPDKLNLTTGANPGEIVYFTISEPSTTTSFPSEIFKQLPSLKEVTITSVGLENLLKDDLKDANNLTELRVPKNKIKLIPANVAVLPPLLTFLSFNHNEIMAIEDGAFNSTTLKEIHLSFNKLTSLKKGMFLDAPNIQSLYLDSNLIDSIEEETFDLPKLEYLMLDYNRLTTLPPKLLVTTPSLQAISLISNQLTEVVAVLEKAHELHSIQLSNNSALKENILQSLQHFPELKYLGLGKTGINSTTAVESLMLTHLSIERNNLTDSGLLNHLKELKNLEVLHLYKNKLQKLDEFEKIREYFPSLESIRLNRNQWDCEWKKLARGVCSEHKIQCHGISKEC